MSRQNLTAIVAFAVFPLGAVGIAAYVIASNVMSTGSVAASILVLAAGVFTLGAALAYRVSQQEEWNWYHQDRWQEANDRVESLAARVDALAADQRQPRARLDEIAAELRSLREAVNRPPEAEQKAAPPPAAIPLTSTSLSDTAVDPASPEAAAPRQRPSSEQLELLLEPVIELATGHTVHYRARLDLTDEHGNIVRHGELMQKADAGGMRPALDTHMARLVAPLLRRLRARHPGMRAFVPLGMPTLASYEDTARILAGLERDADVASGITFELDHRGIGRLDPPGMENLARLARAGAALALADVQVAGLDLAALRQLGVRFLTFPPTAAEAGPSPTSSWRDFVQYARNMQFQIVVSDVVTPQQATAASLLGRFAFGPFFAPPRKVRADAGAGAAQHSASAA